MHHTEVHASERETHTTGGKCSAGQSYPVAEINMTTGKNLLFSFSPLKPDLQLFVHLNQVSNSVVSKQFQIIKNTYSLTKNFNQVFP